MANLCEKCDGRCCRYVAIEIDKPVTKSDFDDVRWYTAHRAVSVFVQDKRWYISFASRCNFLTSDNRCEIYKTRPKICRKHEISECEGPRGDDSSKLVFNKPSDVEEYYKRVVEPKRSARKKRKKKRKAK